MKEINQKIEKEISAVIVFMSQIRIFANMINIDTLNDLIQEGEKIEEKDDQILKEIKAIRQLIFVIKEGSNKTCN